MTVKVYIDKATPTGNQEIPDVVIRIMGEVPDFSGPNFMKEAADHYADEAQGLLDALSKSLPGGTLDRLLAFMLEEKASLLRIPLFERIKTEEQTPPDCPACLIKNRGLGLEHLESCDLYVPF